MIIIEFTEAISRLADLKYKNALLAISIEKLILHLK